MAVVVEPPPRTSIVRRYVPRLLLLVAVLLVLQLCWTLIAGRVVRMGLPGLLCFFFGMGWSGFAPIALAVWLTWGGGRVVVRFLAVIATLLLWCGLNAGLKHLANPSRGSLHVDLEWLLFTLSQILILHALAAPAQKLMGRQLSFQSVSGPAAGRRELKWTLMDALAWTTFAAMALAMIRLHSALLDNILMSPEPLAHWLNFVTQSAPAVAIAPLILWVVFGERLSWLGRVALIVLAVALALGVQQGILFGLSGRWRIRDMLMAALGIVASALLHFGLMRIAGVRWRGVDARACVPAVPGAV